MITSRSLLAAGALAIAGATLAGCGGSSTTDGASTTSTSARQAAADSPTTCPELRGSKTVMLTFTNRTSDLITLRSEPGWSCTEWFSGVSTPASLNGVQVPAGQSVTRPLEHVDNPGRSSRGRFALSFYSGSSNPQIMPITSTGNFLRFVPRGFDRYTNYPYFVVGPDGEPSCRKTTFPTALADGTQATIAFDKPECLGKKAEITFAPR